MQGQRNCYWKNQIGKKEVKQHLEVIGTDDDSFTVGRSEAGQRICKVLQVVVEPGNDKLLARGHPRLWFVPHFLQRIRASEAGWEDVGIRARQVRLKISCASHAKIRNAMLNASALDVLLNRNQYHILICLH